VPFISLPKNNRQLLNDDCKAYGPLAGSESKTSARMTHTAIHEIIGRS